jgi:hypothetical protein
MYELQTLKSSVVLRSVSLSHEKSNDMWCNISMYFKAAGPANTEGQLTGPFTALRKKNKYHENLS